jgi:hypothetical protein
MADLTIHKRVNSMFFGTWKWSEEDHECPLTFQLDGARSQILIEDDRFGERRNLQIPLHLHFKLIFDGAPKAHVAALKSRGAKSTPFAQRVFDYFIETLTRFEATLRVSGKVRHLMTSGTPTLHSFYDTRGTGFMDEGVTWQIGDAEPRPFQPKLPGQPRGKNPLFKHPELVTVEKWKRMQREINANHFPAEETLELHRLAAKVYPKSKRLPIVEAAILIESKLKSYAEAILPDKGFSKSKIKDLRDELTFNTVLNLVLPLTLTKTDLKRVAKWRPHIDRIRKLRNDIVHNNLSDDDIGDKEVLDGIYAAVDLFEFIDSKMK